MIELILELKFDSFLVNSMGDFSDLLEHIPNKALRFSCEKITSAIRLEDNTPSVDFEFLNSSSKHEIKLGFDRELDDQFLEFIVNHDTIDTSRVNIATAASKNRNKPEGASDSEIGRIHFTRLPVKRNLDLKLELVLKSDEFEAVWKITAQQKIQKVIATLVCCKLKQDESQAQNEKILLAGIISSSLRMMPNPAFGV